MGREIHMVQSILSENKQGAHHYKSNWGLFASTIFFPFHMVCRIILIGSMCWHFNTCAGILFKTVYFPFLTPPSNHFSNGQF